MANINSEKYGEVLNSINLNLTMQSSFMESMYNITIDNNEKTVSLLTKILRVSEGERDAMIESIERDERRRLLEDPSQSQDSSEDTSNKEDGSDSKDESKMLSLGTLGKIAAAGIGALIASPFIMGFIEGFFGKTMDKLVDSMKQKALEFLSDPKVILGIGAVVTALGLLLNPISTFIGALKLGGKSIKGLTKLLEKLNLGKTLKVAGLGGLFGALSTTSAATTPKPPVQTDIDRLPKPPVSDAPGTPKPTADVSPNRVSPQAPTPGQVTPGKVPLVSDANRVPPIDEKMAAKAFVKSSAKYGVKMVPIVGAIAGTLFAAGRLIQGDHVGAAMEAGGVLAPSFVGGATIDIAILARDMYKAYYGTNPETDDPELVKQRMVVLKEYIARKLSSASAAKISEEDAYMSSDSARMTPGMSNVGGVTARTAPIGGYNPAPEVTYEEIALKEKFGIDKQTILNSSPEQLDQLASEYGGQSWFDTWTKGNVMKYFNRVKESALVPTSNEEADRIYKEMLGSSVEIVPPTPEDTTLGQKVQQMSSESSAMQSRAAPVFVKGGDSMMRGGDVIKGGDTIITNTTIVESQNFRNHVPV